MSAGSENPFWRVGKKGKGLARTAGVLVIEERGGTPRGDHFDPQFPDRDWIGTAQQGGGSSPATDNWTFSAKENQDRSMGDSTKQLK